MNRALDGRVGGKRRRGVQVDEEMDSDASDDDVPEPDGSRHSPVVIPSDDIGAPETVQDGPTVREIGGIGSALRRNADGTIPVPTKKHKIVCFAPNSLDIPLMRLALDDF